MAKEQIELRADWDALSRAYLFKQPGAGNYANNCLISCHGWYTTKSGTYTPNANTTLHFYVDHGNTLDDLNNSREALSGILAPRANLSVDSNGNCTNYTLGKLQEHKSDIEGLAKRKGWTVDEAEDAMGAFGETYRGLCGVNNTNFDIATVRNRNISSTLTLSKLISAIEREHHYANYYCAFCREMK